MDPGPRRRRRSRPRAARRGGGSGPRGGAGRCCGPRPGPAAPGRPPRPGPRRSGGPAARGRRCRPRGPGQLDPEHGRLEGVEALAPADLGVLVLGGPAVVAGQTRPVGQGVVVGGDRAGVAEGAEVLARVEAERGQSPGRPGPPHRPSAVVRVAPWAWAASSTTGTPASSATAWTCGMSTGRPYRWTGRTAAVPSTAPARALGSTAPGGLVDVDEPWPGPGVDDRLGRGGEGVGDGGHLVAGPTSRAARARWIAAVPGHRPPAGRRRSSRRRPRTPPPRVRMNPAG